MYRVRLTRLYLRQSPGDGSEFIVAALPSTEPSEVVTHRRRCGGFRALALRKGFALISVWLSIAAPAAAQSALEKELDQRVTEITAMIEDYPRVAGLTSEEKRKLVEFTAGNQISPRNVSRALRASGSSATR